MKTNFENFYKHFVFLFENNLLNLYDLKYKEIYVDSILDFIDLRDFMCKYVYIQSNKQVIINDLNKIENQEFFKIFFEIINKNNILLNLYNVYNIYEKNIEELHNEPYNNIETPLIYGFSGLYGYGEPYNNIEKNTTYFYLKEYWYVFKNLKFKNLKYLINNNNIEFENSLILEK